MGYGYYDLLKNRKFLDLLEETLGGDGNALRVLDAGCGPGYVSRFLLDHLPAGSTVVGLEYDEDRVPRESAGPAFLRGSVSALPFADAAFDAVVMNSVIEHVPHHDRLVALRELMRVLARGGTAVFLFPTTLHKAWTFPRLNFHDKHVFGITITLRTLSNPIDLLAHWREAAGLPYYMLRECVEHWPARWRRLVMRALGREAPHVCLNLLSNREPMTRWLYPLEKRVRAMRGFRSAGTSMVFIIRKGTCA